MTTAPDPVPAPAALTGRIIGRTENAIRAVLDRLLADTATTFHQWVVLQLAAGGAGGAGTGTPAGHVVAQLVDGLKVAAAVAEQALVDTEAAGLTDVERTEAGARVTLTPAGRDRYERLAAGIAGITARLYGDLPAADLETTRRVLTIVTERANAELAGAGLTS
jgi:DNA-binding MarR family transcriptional regulator